MKRLISAILLSVAAVVGLWLWERAQVVAMREEIQELAGQVTEAAQLQSQNEEQSRRQAGIDITMPEFSKAELLRLRGEVALARANPPDVDTLRRENHQLAEDIQVIAEQPTRLSQMEGYVGSEAWVHAGLASPEATIRTFWAAIHQEDLQGIVNCLSGQEAKWFASLQEQPKDTLAAKALNELLSITQVGGYRVAGRRTNSVGQVAVGIQVAPGGTVMEMVLQPFGTEWKIVDLFRPRQTSQP